MNGFIAKVLIVDDDPLIYEMLGPYLADEGYQTFTATNGTDAIVLAERHRPDVILLDRKMPGLSGGDVLSELRHRDIDAFVVFLTASGEEIDRIVGLEIGADDYITKPFSVRETVSRIRAILRRRDAGNARVAAASMPAAAIRRKAIVIGDLQVDAVHRSVTIRGCEVPLTPTEFRILELLASEPGRVFSRAQLLENVLPDSLDVMERSLDSHIAHLRRKIEPSAKKPTYVLTVYGFGYKCRPPEGLRPQRAVGPTIQ